MAKKKKALESYDIAQLPNKREVEVFILSSLLQYNEEEAILTLNEDVFFHNDLKEIFRSARRVKAEKGELNLLNILSDMEKDRVALNTFDAIGREALGAEWSGNVDDIKARIRETFTSTLSYYAKLGLQITEVKDYTYERIQELKDLYTSRMAIKAATLLANSAKLGADNVLACIEEIQADLTSVSSQSLASLFEPKTSEFIQERRKINHDGIGTNYFVFKDGERKEITIPRGAITLVCGLPGHCKSTLLLNFALRLAHSEEGKIYYWTYEESDDKTDEKIQNLNYGRDLSKPDLIGGNIQRIREYHKGIKGNICDLSGFEASLAELEKMETSGKFNLISPTCSSLDFVTGLRAHLAKTGDNVSAIFVDYIQMIKSGRNLEKRHDIEEAITDFLNFAKETNIPVIAAAQLNKDAKTPEIMGGNHIAESHDLTRFADTIVCLWNPVKREDLGLDDTAFNKWAYNDWYKNHLLEHGCKIGKGGKLYVRVTKARDIESGADAVYNYNGNTRAIGRNPKEVKEYTKNSDDYPKTGKANPDNWKDKEDKPDTTETKTRPEIRRR